MANPIAPPIEDKNLSVSDMVDLMGEDTPPEEEPKEPKEPKDEPEEVPPVEDEEPEVELEEPKVDSELEYHDIPKRQEILAKYPDIFKTFPAIEKSIYREQQYSEFFPTPAEAKDAKERLDDYSDFEQKILQGDITSVLQSVKQANPQAFDNISGNYLRQLHAVDPNAYQGEISNVLKTAAVNMMNSAKESGDEDLLAAAQIFHKFMFNTTQITGPVLKKAPEKTDEQKRFEGERAQFFNERLGVAVGEVNSKIENIIRANIDKYLDPRKSMTDYVRSNAERDILQKVDEAISSDTRFISIRDQLWKRAMADGFSSRSKDKIKEAVISKAKTVLPEILKSVRGNALKGLGKREIADRIKEDSKPVIKGDGQPREQKPTNKKTDIPRGMSTLDFLNSD